MYASCKSLEYLPLVSNLSVVVRSGRESLRHDLKYVPKVTMLLRIICWMRFLLTLTYIGQTGRPGPVTCNALWTKVKTLSHSGTGKGIKMKVTTTLSSYIRI